MREHGNTGVDEAREGLLQRDQMRSERNEKRKRSFYGRIFKKNEVATLEREPPPPQLGANNLRRIKSQR